MPRQASVNARRRDYTSTIRLPATTTLVGDRHEIEVSRVRYRLSRKQSKLKDTNRKGWFVGGAGDSFRGFLVAALRR
jgi:hypothetical protein